MGHVYNGNTFQGEDDQASFLLLARLLVVLLA